MPAQRFRSPEEVEADSGRNPDEGEATDQQPVAKRPPIRVSINALTDLTPKFGSRVYLLNLTRELSKLTEVNPILLVGIGQTKNLPPDLMGLAREIDVPYDRSYWQIL